MLKTKTEKILEAAKGKKTHHQNNKTDSQHYNKNNGNHTLYLITMYGARFSKYHGNTIL